LILFFNYQWIVLSYVNNLRWWLQYETAIQTVTYEQQFNFRALSKLLWCKSPTKERLVNITFVITALATSALTLWQLYKCIYLVSFNFSKTESIIWRHNYISQDLNNRKQMVIIYHLQPYGNFLKNWKIYNSLI
jgi:hypothetical protein